MGPFIESRYLTKLNFFSEYLDRNEKWLATTQLMNLLLLLLITRPLPRDGGMAGSHGATEARQLPRVWTRGRRETESRQRVSDANSPKLDSAE